MKSRFKIYSTKYKQKNGLWVYMSYSHYLNPPKDVGGFLTVYKPKVYNLGEIYVITHNYSGSYM
jgi:hypothetical protein